MGALTQTQHKSMALLPNGETVFARQLRLLQEVGIREICVTTGPFPEQLAQQAAQPQFAGLRIRFIPNPRYQETNYIYSMFLADGQMQEDVLLLHGDLVLTKPLLERLLRDPRGNLAVYDKRKPLPQKDFKAKLCGTRIMEISVLLEGHDCVAFQPLYKLEQAVFAAWMAQISAFVAQEQTGGYAEEALNAILRRVFIAAFDCGEDFIEEVDTQEDLHRVRATMHVLEYSGGQIVINDPFAYLRIPALFSLHTVKKPLLVCDSAFDGLFLKSFLESVAVKWTQFRDFSPNPTLEQAQNGAEFLLEQDCDALLTVGGGSAMDVAKAIRYYAAQQDEARQETPPVHIVLPTTAGTGSESTPFCALYRNEKKFSLEDASLLPDYVILEPELLRTLPLYQKKATLLDALCQGIEALWSLQATKESRSHAKKAIALILQHTKGYLQGEAAAADFLLQAANESGRAIAQSKTTAAHAMSYQLTSFFHIAHGQAVALCLPVVWKRILDYRKTNILPAEQKKALKQALEDLCDLFYCKDYEETRNTFCGFLLSLQLPSLQAEQGKDFPDCAVLADGVDTQRLGNTPLHLEQAQLREDYRAILREDYKAETKAALRSWDACLLRLEDAVLLRELQMLELEILLEVDRICKKHHITYYLGEGTLLGAVRHEGFIPWDDDVDILMPREDYDRFLSLAPQELPEDMLLQNRRNTGEFHVFFTKVRMTRKTKFSQQYIQSFVKHTGPYIDVFPLDYVPRKSTHKQLYHARKIKALRYAAFYHYGTLKKPKKSKKKRAVYYVSRFLPASFLFWQIERSMRRFNHSSCKRYLVNYGSYYNPVNQTQPASYYGEPRYLPFEGHLLPVPREYHFLLQSIYKRYWQMPPRGKRVIKHHFMVGKTQEGDGAI